MVDHNQFVTRICNRKRLSFVAFFFFFFSFAGTGKTVTGVHVAYWFAKRNKQLTGRYLHDSFDLVLPDSTDKAKTPPQVIYCGPSNKSVDVVASK